MDYIGCLDLFELEKLYSNFNKIKKVFKPIVEKNFFTR